MTEDRDALAHAVDEAMEPVTSAVWGPRLPGAFDGSDSELPPAAYTPTPEDIAEGLRLLELDDPET